jgi:hypothetical protein
VATGGAFPYYLAVPWLHRGALYLSANKGGNKYRNDDLLLLLMLATVKPKRQSTAGLCAVLDLNDTDKN